MVERIRVLIVIDSLKVGGAEALLPTLLHHIDQRRFDLHVLALGTASSNHIQDEVARSVTLSQWPSRRLRDPRRISEIARVIREHDIDIVHTHLLYSNVQASLAARLTRRPAVTTLHNLRQHNRKLKHWLEVGALRATGARALAVSDGVRASYSGRFGLADRQLTVVPNAIDLGRFERLAPEDVARVRAEVLGGAAGPLIVGVGRVVTQKGFAILADAAERIHERYPEALIVIAGREVDGAVDVRTMIAKHGLEGVVQLLGQRGDVPQLLAAADLYVSPSLSEGAPVTHLEAMAAGTPVVATAVGGVPELIDDGQNGLLVPAGEPEPLANAILRALDNPELTRRLAERGRMTVRNYGAEAWARRIEAEYLRLLPGRGVQVAPEVAR